MAQRYPRRVVPNPATLLPLMKLRGATVSRKSRVAAAHTIDDLRDLALRYTPKAPFWFVAGGADEEVAMERNSQAYRDIVFAPRGLVDTSEVDTSIELYGERYAFPLGISPVGFQRAAHHEGEFAGAKAAAAHGIPFGLSTLSSISIEEAAEVSGPTARNWFQLYVDKDHSKGRDLIQRAKEAGFTALFWTVDTRTAGDHARDFRTGMTLPPSFGPKSVLNIARHPGWLLNFLFHEAPGFSNVAHKDGAKGGAVGSAMNTETCLTLDDLEWIRDAWGDGPIFVKGIQRVDDAVRVAEFGADIMLSSHGGRQLDRAVAPIQLLPEVRAAVGDQVRIAIDSGITHGMDVVAALCLGADIGFIGKAYMYGLMAGGTDGAHRALEIFHSQILRTMILLGARDVTELTPDLLYEAAGDLRSLRQVVDRDSVLA